VFVVFVTLHLLVITSIYSCPGPNLSVGECSKTV